MYEEFDLANLRGVVLHELCHYHLHLAGHDCHHTSEFKTLLKRVGGLRYAPAVRQARSNLNGSINAVAAAFGLVACGALTCSGLSVGAAAVILNF